MTPLRSSDQVRGLVLTDHGAAAVLLRPAGGFTSRLFVLRDGDFTDEPAAVSQPACPDAGPTNSGLGSDVLGWGGFAAAPALRLAAQDPDTLAVVCVVTDGGRRLAPSDPGYVPDGLGLAVTLRISRDFGRTWTTGDTIESASRAVAFTIQGDGAVVTTGLPPEEAGEVWVGSGGGTSWVDRSPLDRVRAWTDVVAISGGRYVALTESAAAAADVLVSDVGGTTWRSWGPS